MSRTRRLPTGRRGSALFLSLLVVLVRVSSNHRLTEKDYREMSAMNLAEAGVERAIWELNYGSIASWAGESTLKTLSLSSVAAAGGTVVGAVSVQVANPASDNPVVTATGSVPWTGALTVERKVRVVLKRAFKSFFDFGIFGDEGFDMHGNAYTDSYDSDDGP
jgi:Tfp pilus assembly protein PilX